MPAACSGSPSRPAAWPCRCVGVRDRIDPQAVAQALEQDPTISHVALVYSETSSGICHDAPAIARVAQALGRRVIIDAVSAFGALPLDLSDLPAVDAVALTANKCLEGLPGAAFVVARRDDLDAAQGRAGSWSLDLADIYQQSLQPNAGPRFTRPRPRWPPSPSRWRAIMRKAARPAWRATRPICARCTKAWRDRPDALAAACAAGPHRRQCAPDTPAWDLQAFVDALKRRGYVLSNFKNTEQPSFRVGCIGAFGRPDAASRPGHGRGAVRTRHPRDRRRPEAGAPSTLTA